MGRSTTLFLISIMALAMLAASQPALAADVYHDYYGPYGGDDWDTWEEWERDFRLGNKSHATPPFAPRQTFGGCYIGDGKGGLFDDLDCDKVPDIVDNCLGLPNPDQADQSENRIGDACDLIVDRLVLDPPVVLEGRAFTATATLTNYRPYDLRNVILTVQVPELGLEQKEYIDVIRAGDQELYEFFLRVPGCARRKDYDAVLIVEWPRGPGLVESFYISGRMGVESSGMCVEEPTPAGKTIVNILDIQDIDPELGGAYPFTIINNEPYSQAYVLTVEGTEEWGEYRIEPRSLIVVPAGESREGVLTLFAQEGATGEHGFMLMLRSKADAKQVLLNARIKQEEPDPDERVFLQFGIFIAGAILLILAFALALHRRQQANGRSKAE